MVVDTAKDIQEAALHPGDRGDCAGGSLTTAQPSRLSKLIVATVATAIANTSLEA